MTSLIEMSDSTIEFHERILYEDELSAFGQINLQNYGMNFGVFLKPGNKAIDNYEIPSSIGRIVFRIKDQDPNGENSPWYDSVACSDLFNNSNISFSHFAKYGKENGHCIDP